MPIHDWTRVDAGIFHDFHHAWIEEIKRALNGGLLPEDFYALAEQITGRLGPDVLTLRKPGQISSGDHGVAVASPVPKTRFHGKSESGRYADKTKSVVIRHRSKHDIVAMIEIVSPGNKESLRPLTAFAHKAEDALAAGIHLLIVDLLPPGTRDPHGIRPVIWADRDDEFVFDAAKPLTCVAYVGGSVPEAFIEPVAVGDPLPQMPLFLSADFHVLVPLEETYGSAWGAVPAYWREIVAGS